jgi:hypothetical protein
VVCVYENPLSGRCWTQLRVERRLVVIEKRFGILPQTLSIENVLGEISHSRPIWLLPSPTTHHQARHWYDALIPSTTQRSVKLLYDMKRYQLYLFTFTLLYDLCHGSYLLPLALGAGTEPTGDGRLQEQ